MIMSINNESKIAISTTPKSTINISNSSSLEEHFKNMKNDLSTIISYMDLAVNQCTEKNAQLALEKEKVTNLTNLAKKYNQESINLNSQLHEYHNTISIQGHEVLKAKTALDGVMELTSDISQTDIDKIKKILEDSFIEKTRELEKSYKELELFEKTKNAKDEKVAKLQDSLSRIEAEYFQQVSNTNLFTSNVEQTVLDITQAYSDIMSKSNDMLQMTINVKQHVPSNVEPTSEVEESSFTDEKAKVLN